AAVLRLGPLAIDALSCLNRLPGRSIRWTAFEGIRYEMGRVQNKIALVTGAAQGLGAAIARLLAREGAKVLLTDINIEGAEQRVAEIDALHPGSAGALQQDVTEETQWIRAIDVAHSRFGGLHILVNNAGVGS